MTVRHTSHARFDLWYHFAWSTKYRKHVWTDPAKREAVKRLFRKIAERFDMAIGTIELLSDHIHFTLTAPPRIAPARAAQILKSVSTKALFAWYPELKREYWGGELWVAGYFVRSVGPGLTKEQIDKYIEEQAEEV
jgi:putative transposase